MAALVLPIQTSAACSTCCVVQEVLQALHTHLGSQQQGETDAALQVRMAVAPLGSTGQSIGPMQLPTNLWLKLHGIA